MRHPNTYSAIETKQWVCSNCGNVENKEREILCWKCGKGEMIYHPYYTKNTDETKDGGRIVRGE